MKRIITLLLVLALILAPAALAESRIMKVEEETYLRALLTDGETLYAFCDTKLYAWRPGEDALTPYESDIRLPDGETDDEPLELYRINPFLDGGALRALYTQGMYGEGQLSLNVIDLVLTDGGKVEAGDVKPLALPETLRDNDWFYVNQSCAADGMLYMLSDGETGDMLLCAVDLTDAGRDWDEELTGWDYQLFATPEGVVLANRDYQKDVMTLSRVTPGGMGEELCTLSTEIWAIGADPQTGDVFAVYEGRVRPLDLGTGELGDAVAALPVRPQYAAVLDGGRVFATNLSGGVALLDTDKQLSEDQVLTIRCEGYDTWLMNAVLEYSVTHPECTPVMLDDYRSVDQLLSAMLSQSADTDVYIMNTGYNTAYQALLDRGYMLPLDGSAAISAFVARVYPALQKGLTQNGAPVAVPLMVEGTGMGVSEALLGRLGLSIDDVPRDWLGFLDFLESEIAPRMDEFTDLDHFTYDGMTADLFRTNLRYHILDDFFFAAEAKGEIPNYEDPYLVQLLERVDSMDFTQFGLEPSEDEDGGWGWSDDTSYLVQFDADYTFNNNMMEGTPLPLGFGDDLPGVLPIHVTAAFVNPYSAHAEAAVEMLEALVGQLSTEAQYALCPDLNEPAKNPDADRILAQYEDQIEEFKRQLEKADPADRQEMEESFANWEQGYERYKEVGIWLVSAEKLAWYRANGDHLVMATPSWFSRDTSGEAWELLSQYDAGLLSAREFLTAVNRKARMMAMEG